MANKTTLYSSKSCLVFHCLFYPQWSTSRATVLHLNATAIAIVALKVNVPKRKRVPPFSFRYLSEHRLAVLSHHGALVAVEGHKVAVERLLGVLQHVEQLSGAPFEDTPEVPRN